MDEKRLREIADLCREAIDLVPNDNIEQEKNGSRMFSQLRAIALVCMENLDLSAELKRIIPIKKQGELYDSVRSIHGRRSFSLNEAGNIRTQLSIIEKILREAAIDLSPKTRLERGDFTVFYSWQADLPNSTNRGFIKGAVEKAVSQLRDKYKLEFKPIVESDTSNTPGSPDIIHTILSKIERSSVFIADVSIVDGKKPNPNVIFELGYALKTLGSSQIIMVFNCTYGKLGDLPFDLGFKRQILYELEEQTDDKTQERNRLVSAIQNALKTIISSSDLDG